MNHYSDPTASKAIGNIDREFAQKTKRAKKLCELYKAGKITSAEFEKVRGEFRGIYRHVLDIALEEMS